MTRTKHHHILQFFSVFNFKSLCPGQRNASSFAVWLSDSDPNQGNLHFSASLPYLALTLSDVVNAEDRDCSTILKDRVIEIFELAMQRMHDLIYAVMLAMGR